MRILTLLFFLPLFLLGATEISDADLKAQIGRMLIVGFDAETLDASDPFVRELRQYKPGGVILFDLGYPDLKRTKNIRSPRQLAALTAQLQAFATAPLLVSVDQEGGRVARLKPAYGFPEVPSAEAVGMRDDPAYAQQVYGTLATTLSDAGINTDFAPDVDLAVNPDNTVIVGLKRSYGKSPEKVTRYAGIMLDALRAKKVVGVLKHFPGHGSSLGDSHKGFVDVSETWTPVELEPYRRLINEGKADMIMTAHVFNRRLDPDYPATLSHKINTELLRGELGFKGVIVSDDLQMKAISEHYSLEETVRLAINGGVDMLLFANQLGSNMLGRIVETIYAEVKAGRISRERIVESNRRINALYDAYGIGAPKIVDKPIAFGPQRTALTKQYIKQHYGMDVSDITIDPKVIVLHWTADMGLKSSFARLQPELLPGSRGDIATAGALNVSSQFLVDRDGTIYRLMPENRMARHVIGLNYDSIGIENVGGEGNAKEDLTPAQLRANIALVRYLAGKYPHMEYLIGHHEYRRMEATPLWRERDKGYRTEKSDPGEAFMRKVRSAVSDLHLKAPPEAR
ncbi:glycoside hydrolase family 3 N-terminal domain-containing protein [Sulfurimonas sp. HSL1-2]|uniref:glycoside hydrolase family 3 N-terminal domain-containing protein n=1 Tax=Thiomicrolovo zhangzhouensis TaxID=3131933 RepID=UPI0031F9FAA7